MDPESEIVVIFDDISLSPGQIRVKRKGSAGGHNGIKSIIKSLGTQNFSRVKVGVGEKPKEWDLADYVLSRPNADEIIKINDGLNDAKDAALLVAKGETTFAMNSFNKKKVKGD